MPEPVLEQAAAEMLDWHGCGMSVMEMSHRGEQFIEICSQAETDLRELLAIPQDYAVLLQDIYRRYNTELISDFYSE